MNSFIVLLIIIGMVVFFYKILIKPFMQGYKDTDNNTTDILKIEVVEKNTEESMPQAPQTTQVSAKLSPELYKRLNGYCDYKGLSKTYVINEAVAKYLDEIENVKSHIGDK